MKKAFFAAVALASLGFATAGAASAASYRDPGIDRRQADIEMRIDRGMRNGALTRFEARDLRRELRNIEFLEARYERNGFNRWERVDLNRRLDALSARVFDQRHDDDRRFDRDRDHRRY